MLRTRAAVACLLMLVVWSTATVIADEVPHPTIVGAIDHSPSVYTQGLEVRNGSLFESAGLQDATREGGSRLMKRNLTTFDVEIDVDLTAVVGDVFAEGITLHGDDLIMLTWRNGTAHVFDATNLTYQNRSFSYDGEGWGICSMDDRLMMSNGTAGLQIRDPTNFSLLGEITLRYRIPTEANISGPSEPRLNELECHDGMVYANVWMTPLILAIDVDAGNVTNVVDLRRANWSLPDRSIDEAGRLSLNGSRIGNNDAVLNGIAWDETRNGFLISGKDWPETYLINDLANWTIGSAWDVSSPESDSEAAPGPATPAPMAPSRAWIVLICAGIATTGLLLIRRIEALIILGNEV